MVEDSLPLKNDEQYPLLKVESGGGDSGRPTPSVVTPGWHVAGPPKRSWLDRWPEIISAFWMSGMLLGIFCLMLYGVGFSVIKRQPLVILRCNSSKPGTEVFYHHIVRSGSEIPFNQFSEYLSNMASLYPLLRFNVFFLVDDTLQSEYRSSRHSRLFKKLIPYHYKLREHVDENSQQDLKDFHAKHNNVNITITPLSKYMAKTPLRYRWKTIPMSYLTFYARVFSVWQNGGIGMDLDTFSAQFNHRQLPDRRITEIFKQHNNGIKPDEYTNALNNIDREEKNEFISLFYGIIHQIMNETRAFFNRTLLYTDEKDKPPMQPLVRTHRNKRDLRKNSLENTFNSSNTEKSSVNQIVKSINITGSNIVDEAYKNAIATTDKHYATNKVNQSMKAMQPRENENRETLNNSIPNFVISKKNASEVLPQVLVLYDFSLLSDNSLGPPYLFPETFVQGDVPPLPTAEHVSETVNHSKSLPFILSINAEGTFIAASMKQHPLLAHIVSARCHRLPPKCAIEDAMISQCSNMFKDDFYCSNIYLLY